MTAVLTLCPNIIVLAVSPLCRGDGPIVMTSEVLAVPVKISRIQTPKKFNKEKYRLCKCKCSDAIA